MTLGELIEVLENAPQCPVVYQDINDGERHYPGDFDSWRGVYAELSLEPVGQPTTVKELLAKAKEADGKTFQGYKGGDFTMGKHTAVWADPYGESVGRGIVGHKFEESSGTTTLILTTLVIPWEYR
jgi:hypothetical protein